MDTRPSRFIDFHVHVFPDDIAPKAIARFVDVYGAPPLSDGTVSGTLAYMDEAGIDIFVPQPVATKPSQVRSINDWALSIRSDRVIPFASIHPGYPDIEGEIGRLASEGFRGIKLQPDWQEFYPDDEEAFPIYEAAQGRLAIMFHAGREIKEMDIVRATPERLLKVHQRFRGLTMIAAHMGGYQSWHDAEASLSGTGVYFDISYCPENELPTPELVRLIRKHGTGRVLFASDFPFADPKKDVERLAAIPLSEQEKEDIAWRNGARLLALGGGCI